MAQKMALPLVPSRQMQNHPAAFTCKGIEGQAKRRRPLCGACLKAASVHATRGTSLVALRDSAPR